MTVETPSPCVRCGGKSLPILYGDPTYDAVLAHQRGDLVLGGCVIAPGLPEWTCGNCGHQWGSLECGGPVLGSPWDDLGEDPSTA